MDDLKDKEDAERFRWLMANGFVNEKQPSRAVADSSLLKSLFVFRYWGTAEEVIAVIDKRRGKS